MALPTLTWNPAAPAGGDALSAGDDSIRDFKDSLSERLRNGGHAWQAAGSGSTLIATDGRHACGVAATAGSTVDTAGEFAIFATDAATPLFNFRGGTSAAAATAGNTPGELHTGLAIRGGGIVKGVTLSASTSIIPTALTDNAINHNEVDIGADANRFRDLYVGRNTDIDGTLNVQGIATFQAVPVFSAGSSFATLTTTGLFTLGAGYKISGTTTVASGSYTVLATDHLILCTMTGAITLNLPTAASVTGQHFYIAIPANVVSTNVVTITPNGAEVIDGYASMPLRRQIVTDRSGMHIISNGVSWTVLSAFIHPSA